MSVINKRIADIFDEIADLLEIEADNPFRIRAYRNGARFLRGLGRDVSEMVERGDDLTKLPNIGRDLDAKIREIINTDRCETLEKLHDQIPATLRELLRVPGLGVKRAQNLFLELKIASLDELRQAAEQHKIRDLPGFGAAIEQTILDSLTRGRPNSA